MFADSVFKALADPTRREILRVLSEGETSAGEIASRFQTSAPTISHHFNVLKDADLIAARKNGNQVLYSLNSTVLDDLLLALMDTFASRTRLTGESK